MVRRFASSAGQNEPEPSEPHREPGKAAKHRAEGKAGRREHDPEHWNVARQKTAARGATDAAGLPEEDRIFENEDHQSE